MKTSIIRSSWLPKGGYRLDCSPYLGGALETEILLGKLSVRKDPLSAVTKTIFNGPQFVRTYVEDPQLGVPFMTGSSMLLADFSDLPLLSRRDAHGAKLAHLCTKPGMSLISCSGTIGKMAYARPEMDGIWGSQDILKVVPNVAQIPPGYLYAFLSSKFGVPLITSGTYGAIIQYLEPVHIAGLSVPRFGDAIEQEIHVLVEEAARFRCKSNEVFHSALFELIEIAGIAEETKTFIDRKFRHCVISSSALGVRFDTNFHSHSNYLATSQIDEGKFGGIPVGSIAERVVEMPRFKRVPIDDPGSAELFGTGDIMNIDPQPISRIARFPGHETYAVGSRTVLVPRSGQLNGIIGTAVLPIGGLRQGVVSEHAIRINCFSEEVAGFIFLALSLPQGRAQLKARAFGGSIPTLDVFNVSSVRIPDFPLKVRQRLGAKGFLISELRTAAIEHEAKAQCILERAIHNHA